MDKLRLFLIDKGYSIKLTQEESKNGKIKPANAYQNSSWLMQDRGVLKYTHPEYPGPFTTENVSIYHIYCTLETWIKLGEDLKWHWDYRGDDGYISYNPPNTAYLNRCDKYLPITQRKNIGRYDMISAEIFDDLSPFYY